MKRLWIPLLVLSVCTLLLSGPALSAADDAPPKKTPEELKEEAPKAKHATTEELEILREDTDWLWTCIAAFLVFFMQAGFAMVEAGFTRAKNAVNILMKNLMDFSMGSIIFWAVGFGLMFGATTTGWFGTNYFFLSGAEDGTGRPMSGVATFWIFQTVFAATAATIVSGGVAERTKFIGYLCYTVVITALIYPIFGSWAWGSLWKGGGWLEDLSFIDFAGSTVVHSVGGWAALAGAIVLGARHGKFGPDGKARSIPGHSMPMAALGVFILWLGWFGFNPGSTTSVGSGEFARVAVTTNLAAAAGAIAAMVTSWIVSSTRKPQIDMALNGALAGLVAITAPCYTVTFAGSILIGLIGGVLVYFSVRFFESIKVDDPVGAVSVHAVCGAWGTLACGLFGAEKLLGLDGADANTGLFYGGGVGQLWIQFVGVAACFIWVMGTCLALFTFLKMAGLLRASAEDELQGLDFSEHGTEAYPGFVHAIEMDQPLNGGVEPRKAMVPAADAKRFAIVVQGLSNEDLKSLWSELCQPRDQTSAELKAVYPYLTTMEGATFHFRGGDPEAVRSKLETLLKSESKNEGVSAQLAS